MANTRSLVQLTETRFPGPKVHEDLLNLKILDCIVWAVNGSGRLLLSWQSAPSSSVNHNENSNVTVLHGMLKIWFFDPKKSV